MKCLKRLSALIIFLMCATSIFAADDDTNTDLSNAIRLGVAPYNSANALIKTHKMLREYLEEKLGRRVVVYTSVNHSQFLKDTIAGKFDIVITPPHFAPIMIDNGFAPLMRYKTALNIVLIVHKDSDIKSVADMRGTKIGLPDWLSLFYLAGIQWLKTLDMTEGTDYQISEQLSHATAMAAVAAKQLDIAVTAPQPFMQLSADIKEQLKMLNISVKLDLMSMMFLANKTLGEKQIDDIADALYDFETTLKGKEFFRSTGYGGFMPLEPTDIKSMRIYESMILQLQGAKR